jgi:ornithine carbamoyltransferase
MGCCPSPKALADIRKEEAQTILERHGVYKKLIAAARKVETEVTVSFRSVRTRNTVSNAAKNLGFITYNFRDEEKKLKIYF